MEEEIQYLFKLVDMRIREIKDKEPTKEELDVIERLYQGATFEELSKEFKLGAQIGALKKDTIKNRYHDAATNTIKACFLYCLQFENFVAMNLWRVAFYVFLEATCLLSALMVNTFAFTLLMAACMVIVLIPLQKLYLKIYLGRKGVRWMMELLASHRDKPRQPESIVDGDYTMSDMD